MQSPSVCESLVDAAARNQILQQNSSSHIIQSAHNIGGLGFWRALPEKLWEAELQLNSARLDESLQIFFKLHCPCRKFCTTFPGERRHKLGLGQESVNQGFRKLGNLWLGGIRIRISAWSFTIRVRRRPQMKSKVHEIASNISNYGIEVDNLLLTKNDAEVHESMSRWEVNQGYRKAGNFVNT